MDLTRLTRRRDFLLNLGIGLALIPGFGLAADYIRRYLVPLRQKGSEEILLARLSELPVGSSRLFNDVIGSDLIAVRLGEKDVKVFSSICTHLGCRVGWDPTHGDFLCPCHVGRFDTSGRVTAGPPPAPLPQYAVRLEGDQLYVTVPVGEA